MVGASALHLRLASPDHHARAQALIAGVLGDGILPASDPLSLTARLTRPDQAASVLGALTAAEVELAEFSVGHPSLDEVFFALTGHATGDASPEERA